MFQPKESTKFTKDAGGVDVFMRLLDHLAQVIELLGGFPKSQIKGSYANEIFSKKGTFSCPQ